MKTMESKIAPYLFWYLYLRTGIAHERCVRKSETM